ncbi:hypothetical protein FNH22_05030 [Fulvivirga sp. M361]|uniref:hypothetical protein n=1 Tax=Fulvivirga sp. M361 TaxID=2594266 RepID=UPI00117ABC38|nr:hypothetical protein [Fulvivirga sp. M361]TRX61422.1 hypothetical protein FNH22_05030 [Fulvivirga sp. M361]
MDTARDLLLYFEPLENHKIRLLALKLNNYKHRVIAEFEHYDFNETPQIIKFDKITGEIHLVAKDKRYSNCTLFFNL